MELDAVDVGIGRSAETMERRALALIGTPREVEGYGKRYRRVCEHDTRPMPRGCWDDPSRSPYAKYGAERWCDACIAYAALNGTLPRPQVQIDGRVGYERQGTSYDAGAIGYERQGRDSR